MTKFHRLFFYSSISLSCAPLQLVHLDIWDLTPIVSNNGLHYYVFFIDDFTRFSWIYFLHTNDKVTKMFPLFKAQVENLLNTIIKAIRTDDDTEYNMLNTLFSQINHQATCPYTSQQNNISEKNIDMSLNSL
jgi:hypothetical protein